MKKTGEQYNLDVGNACRDVEREKRHRFDGLFDRIKQTFEILESRYGWDEDDLRRRYPDSTIKQAIREGWRPSKKLARLAATGKNCELE